MKKLFAAMLLCMVSFTACDTGLPTYGSPEEEYSADAQNYILGKWKLVGKSIKDGTLNSGYTDDIEKDIYIEFTKNGNNVYGNYTSNQYPEEAYYIVTGNSLYFYYSLDSLKKNSYLFDAAFFHTAFSDIDSFRILSPEGWFNDNSEYKVYYFTKMED